MNLELRDHYLSLLLVLKATHLQEGSRVVTLCNMNISKNHKAYLEWNLWEISPKRSTQSLIALSLLPCTLTPFPSSVYRGCQWEPQLLTGRG